MSDRESSEPPRGAYGAAEFTRWPGLLSLTLGWLLPPVVALINQQFIYAANMWACGRNAHGTLHIIPALCLIVTIATGVVAWRDWKKAGGGIEDEAEGVVGRTQFIAIGGIITSVFSSMVVIAQWAAIFMFDPCMRA